MRNSLILFLLITSITVFCQSDNLNRINIGITYSSIGNYRTIESSLFSDLRNEYEGIQFGNGIGLQLLFNLNDKYSLKSGLYYQQRGFRFKRVFFENEYDPAVPDYTDRKEEYSYITIPLLIRLNQNLSKIYLFESLGINTNFFHNHTSTTTMVRGDNIESTSITNRGGPYNLTISPIINIGIGIQLLELLVFEISPFIQHDIIKIEDIDPGTYLFDFGLTAALLYKF